MNTHQQVGKLVANVSRFFANLPKLASGLKAKFIYYQYITDRLANWQIGSVANLPTSPISGGNGVLLSIVVGENSPSYYVGEGTNVPSILRGGD